MKPTRTPARREERATIVRLPAIGESFASIAIAALCTSVAIAGCAREISSDEAEAAGDEARPTVAAAVPEADARPSFATNLYSEHDTDVYNRLMIEETVGVGTPITAIHVEVGDRVRKGQLLATLDDADARLDVELAEPRAETAASNLRRIEELRKTGAVSEAELEDATFESRTARAALEKARLNLSRTRIRAPFAGVVSRRYVRVGDVVDDETPVFRVTALSPLRARLLVPESDVASFGVGAPVSLRATDGTTGTARVIIVGPTVDPGSGTREVIVQLDDIGGFRPGTSITAELADQPDPGAIDGDSRPTGPDPGPKEPDPNDPAEVAT